MPLRCVKPMHNVGCYTSSMGQSNPLGPEIARYTICGYGDLRKDTFKDLTSTVAPPALNFQYKWDKLLLRVLHEEAELVPLILRLHDLSCSRKV